MNQRDADPTGTAQAFHRRKLLRGRRRVACGQRCQPPVPNHNALYAAKRFPALVSLEKNIIGACLELFNGPKAGGNLTSGGTESLLLAVMTARDWAADQRPVPGTPEIVVPEAAHPGFDKAAHLMGLKAHRLQQSTDYRADPAQLAAASVTTPSWSSPQRRPIHSA
ncbi:MAG: hypothetical protein Ct9H300mP16_00180 [Pseudomonadota bacterium]|nr:MAG: hypothetical protein Ct9H300mP16_00180 [Pseudomonadota bacterium]